MAYAADDALVGGPVKRFRDAPEAAKVRPEIHEFHAGDHGFGMTRQGFTSDHWLQELDWWLDGANSFSPRLDHGNFRKWVMAFVARSSPVQTTVKNCCVPKLLFLLQREGVNVVRSHIAKQHRCVCPIQAHPHAERACVTESLQIDNSLLSATRDADSKHSRIIFPEAQDVKELAI